MEKTKKPKLLINHTSNEKPVAYVKEVVETKGDLILKGQATKEFTQEQLHARLIAVLDELKELGYNQKQAFKAIDYKGDALISLMRHKKQRVTSRVVTALELFLKSVK